MRITRSRTSICAVQHCPIDAPLSARDALRSPRSPRRSKPHRQHDQTAGSNKAAPLHHNTFVLERQGVVRPSASGKGLSTCPHPALVLHPASLVLPALFVYFRIGAVVSSSEASGVSSDQIAKGRDSFLWTSFCSHHAAVKSQLGISVGRCS